MNSFINRMIGAAKLEVSTYEEVEHDSSATVQAAAVVVLASIAAGIGALGVVGPGGFVLTIILALIGWIVWAAVAWFVGTKILPQHQTEADIGQLLRTMGFASAPGVLRIFDFIPAIGVIISIVVSIWMLVATVIAVRQALDYDNTWRAVGVVAVGWIIYLLILMLLGGLAAGGASAMH